MANVNDMLAQIKALEASVETKNGQLLTQQQQLSDYQASKRRRLHGLNDVKSLGTKLQVMRETHVKFCTKHAGGKTTPKTLPTRTKLLQFLDATIENYQQEFAEHLEVIAEEEAHPPAKKKKPED